MDKHYLEWNTLINRATVAQAV